MPTRLLTRGSWPEAQALRRDSPQGDRRRRAAVVRRRRGPGVGELAVVGDLQRRCRSSSIGPESLHLRPERGDVGGRRSAGDLLLRRRAWNSSASSSPATCAIPARAALPIAAAIGGMIVPAAIFIAINLVAGHPENIDGWAVPIATDIAFALAVLAVLSTHLPTALRTFLLTLAVVDDLLAIIVIAVFFTDDLSLGPAGAGADSRSGCSRSRCSAVCTHWWLLLPLAVRDLGAGARQRRARHRRRRAARLHGSGARRTARVAPSPSSTRCGRCPRVSRCPVFAFFAAGVTVGGWSGLGDALLHPVTDRRHRRPGRSASRSACWLTAFLLGQVHPRHASTTTSPGATCSASRCWPASGSRCRC